MPVFVDKNDLDVSAASESSVAELDRFGTALLAFSDDVDCIIALADADPDCALAQAYAAQFYASGETRESLQQSRSYMTRAKALSAGALPREQAIIRAAEHWCRTERNAAANILEQVLDDHPNDIVTAKWAQALHFDTGNPAGILRAPLKVKDACRHDAHLQGMLAFGYEECHLLDEAERAVEKALSIQRKEPWAHHAMAHVNEARNRVDDGIRFMMDVSDTWTGLTSFMTTHNWWHVCLFLIDLNRADEALDYFDSVVWATNQDCVQDQINAISLLYRLERTGVDVGERWQDIAEKILKNTKSQVSVFLDFQFLYALARADHRETIPMMERMIERAETASEDERAAWLDVAVPAAPGIVALARRDHKTAVHQIGLARPFLQCIGGSHAQRELVSLFFIDALRGAGEWSRVQQILSIRHRARPRASWIKSQLNEAYHNLGLGEELSLR